MPRLKPSEARLAAALGFLLFAGALALLVRAGLEARARAIAELDLAREQRAISEELLAQAPMWRERSQWLTDALPRFPSRTEASPATQRTVKSAAEQHGLQVTAQSFLDTGEARTAAAEEAGVAMTLRGSVEQTVRFLHEIQQPGRFIDVRRLSLKPDEAEGADGMVICMLELVQYFRED